MLSKGILLLHDNARPHTFRRTWDLIESFGWKVLDLALYSPNLTSSDFFLFRFSDNEEMKAAMNFWLSEQVADYFEEDFQNLVLRYDMCINKQGNYVEK
ncbi:Mariner Mos1 transposase, partial [Stegodyphus mimosarum]